MSSSHRSANSSHQEYGVANYSAGEQAISSEKLTKTWRLVETNLPLVHE